MFVEIADKTTAQKFFSDVFTLKELPVLNENFDEVYAREMRAYLVKSEAEFQRLALKKY